MKGMTLRYTHETPRTHQSYASPELNYSADAFQFLDSDNTIYRLTWNNHEDGFRFDFPTGKYFDNISILSFVKETSPLEGKINLNVREWVWQRIYNLERKQLNAASDEEEQKLDD